MWFCWLAVSIAQLYAATVDITEVYSFYSQCNQALPHPPEQKSEWEWGLGKNLEYWIVSRFLVTIVYCVYCHLPCDSVLERQIHVCHVPSDTMRDSSLLLPSEPAPVIAVRGVGLEAISQP